MSVLLFGEKSDQFPIAFEKLFNKLKESRETTNNEFLFLAFLYNVFETGFILCGDDFNNFNTSDFNNIFLQKLGEMKPSDIYEISKSENIIVYSARLRIGPPGSSEVTIRGEPSVNSVSQFLTVNIFTKNPNCLTSYCFKTIDFIEKKSQNIVLKNQRKLSSIVKNELAVPVKQRVLLHMYPGCLPHLTRMPYLVKRMIVRRLPYMPYVEEIIDYADPN